jgi:hypothetical protein
MKHLTLSAGRTRLGRAGAGVALTTAALGAVMAMTPGTALAAPSASRPPCAKVPSCFGAIAVGISGDQPVVGFAGGFAKPHLAEATAVNECIQAGGTSCTLTIAYRNSWGAVAVGDVSTGLYFKSVAVAGTSKAAEFRVQNRALNGCRSFGATDCRIATVDNSITGPGKPL